jgi:uncharacterized membrane protein YkgB
MTTVALTSLLIPIIFLLVIGIIWVSFIYFRSQEKQMMIEKGLTQEQMKELFNTKRYPHLYLSLKLGILILFIGFGLGLGFLFQSFTGNSNWLAFFIVTLTGVGFVVGFIVAKKYERREKGNEKQD